MGGRDNTGQCSVSPGGRWGGCRCRGALKGRPCPPGIHRPRRKKNAPLDPTTGAPTLALHILVPPFVPARAPPAHDEAVLLAVRCVAREAGRSACVASPRQGIRVPGARARGERKRGSAPPLFADREGRASEATTATAGGGVFWWAPPRAVACAFLPSPCPGCKARQARHLSVSSVLASEPPRGAARPPWPTPAPAATNSSAAARPSSHAPPSRPTRPPLPAHSARHDCAVPAHHGRALPGCADLPGCAADGRVRFFWERGEKEADVGGGLANPLPARPRPPAEAMVWGVRALLEVAKQSRNTTARPERGPRRP